VLVGGYGSASAYSTSYPIGAVSGYTSYNASAYGYSAPPNNSGYAAYGSSSY